MGFASIHAVVVTHNSDRHITGCLGSLAAQMPNDGSTITVIDNASEDGTVSRVRRYFPHVEIIEVGSNLGFARGVNWGAARRRAGTKWLLLVNPDVRLEQHALRLLIALADQAPGAGIYGGQPCDDSGTPLPGAYLAAPSLRQAVAWATRVRHLRPLRWLDPDEMSFDARDVFRPVPVLVGSLLLIEVRLWEQLDGFDETFVQYGEDVDFCLRAREIGATPLFCGRSRYLHVGGASVPPTERTVLVLRGKAELYRRRLSPLRGALAVLALKVGVAARASFSSRSTTDWEAVWSSRRKWAYGFSHGDGPRLTPAPPDS